MKIKNKNPHLIKIESIEYGECFCFCNTLYIRVNHPTIPVCAVRVCDGKFFEICHVCVKKVNAKLIVECQ